MTTPDSMGELLLYRWGYWMRRAPALRLGYPSQAVGVWMIDAGRDRSRPEYWRRARRRLYMAPEPKPRQTRAAGSRQVDPWPPEVEAADRIVAAMPFAYRQCLLAKYWLELTQVEAAQQTGVSRWHYRCYLAQAEARFIECLQSRQDLVQFG